ncbi:DinB family protein [Cohnella sp. 56]|uniref:DinB family protein n=1 Tax=Cohnella sp. 56 TaxID=3113722 RepID=UPI0030E93831
MSDSQAVLERYRSITNWAGELAALDEAAWIRPIAAGKASTAGIIAHLLNWDRYLIIYAIPAVQRGEGVVFPDFDPFNAAAYDYARSGVSQRQLLDEFRATREELCELLLDIGEDTLRRPVTANGVERCPHTGTPYSLLYIIEEFIDHDRHHQNQIDHVRLALQGGA